MLPENPPGETVHSPATSQHETVHRNSLRLAIYAGVFAAGLAFSLPAGWAYNHGVQFIRLCQHAARLRDLGDGATPVRNLLGLSPEVAPLCPQPETPDALAINVDARRQRIPILRRFRR